MVMELVDGIRLDECIDSEAVQDEIGWLDVMLQLCHGLADAERKGVIHGDIKPANILMDEQGNTKLSDFGIARVTGDHDDRILGTPLYIAPEKTKRERSDSRSDQFSLGATFWHILSGYPPFPGRTSKEVVLRRFETPQPDIREYASHISPATAFLLRKMMATDPEKRFPTFDAVAAEVEEIISDLEEQALLDEQHREVLEFEAKEMHRLQVKNRILVVGCVLMLTLIGYIWMAFFI
jgi:serine/threonine-protein kinase